jgi:hypothetical protein
MSFAPFPYLAVPLLLVSLVSAPAPALARSGDGQPLAHQLFTAQDYAQARELTKIILERYPPDEYVYVGMGRSPTPITAMLKTLFGDDAAINVPLSNMATFSPNPKQKGVFMGDDGELHSVGPPTRTQERVYNLRHHLDQFIPPDEKLGGRKILLIDYANSGDSLVNGDREIREYLRERNPAHPTELKSFGFAESDGVRSILKRKSIAGYEPPTSLKHLFSVRAFAATSEYPQLSIYDPKMDAKTYKKPEVARKNGRTPFRDLMDLWRTRFENDTDFKAYVAEKFPGSPLFAKPTPASLKAIQQRITEKIRAALGCR